MQFGVRTIGYKRVDVEEATVHELDVELPPLPKPSPDVYLQRLAGFIFVAVVSIGEHYIVQKGIRADGKIDEEEWYWLRVCATETVVVFFCYAWLLLSPFDSKIYRTKDTCFPVPDVDVAVYSTAGGNKR